MRLLLFSLVSMVLTAMAGEPQRHTFTSGDHIITMDVRFADPYVGTPLAFYSTTDPLKQICLAGNGESGACPSRFVGAVATVSFTVQRAGGKLRGKTSIRGIRDRHRAIVRLAAAASVR